jgi:hypothetical protein
MTVTLICPGEVKIADSGVPPALVSGFPPRNTPPVPADHRPKWV